MTVLRMWIDKFEREVLIDSDHPLAVAQRAKNEQQDKQQNEPNPVIGATTADTHEGSSPAAPVDPDHGTGSTTTTEAAKPPRARRRARP